MTHYFASPVGNLINIYPATTYSGHNIKAVDISVPEGSPIYAIETGMIEEVGTNDTEGNYIHMIVYDENWNGNTTLYVRYMHLKSYSVKLQDNVFKGQNIGFSGNTGDSTGPHLHIDLSINGFNTDKIEVNNENSTMYKNNISNNTSLWNSVKKLARLQGENNTQIYNYWLFGQTASYQSFSTWTVGFTEDMSCSTNNYEVNERIALIYKALRAAGYGKNLSIGILGNIYMESSYMTDRLEECAAGLAAENYSVLASDYNYNVDYFCNRISSLTGKGTGPLSYGGGYGLVQFTSPENKQALFNAAKASGTDHLDYLDVQIQALLAVYENRELDSGYSNHYGLSWNFQEDESIAEDSYKNAVKMFFCEYEKGTWSDERLTEADKIANIVKTLEV